MNTEVIHNEAKARYEITLDGDLAGFADYESRPGRVVFTHTEINSKLEGRGLGGRLVQGALDDVRGQGLRAVPACSFVKRWIDQHPDYQDLVQSSAS
ncbi:GNAT family N-acetyltransferase [Spirillospora albida]|uniref:GNAT family N-acetyltransferase n=1 Tax=Spirillospora albida TaxID=58123 RepID=UPI0004C0A894|nr:GNAT family N-acetyltransferase [Spirillospora albida]